MFVSALLLLSDNLNTINTINPLDFLAAILVPLLLFAMTAQAMAPPEIPPLAVSSSSLSSCSSRSTGSTFLPLSPIPSNTRAATTSTNIHLVILIHGWLGSPAEMTAIQAALQTQIQIMAAEDTPDTSSDTPDTQNGPINNDIQLPPDTSVLLHSVECNDGKTHDGIIMGGCRVAQEVNDIVQEILLQDGPKKISLSFIGNSLGGLYARAALPHIQWTVNIDNNDNQQQAETIQISPNVFCTTCTPHLGKRGLTYLPLPRFVETGIGYALQPTGQDLFGVTTVVQDLASQAKYLTPLSHFAKRIAYANAFGTDLQVPTATAGFLADTESPHFLAPPSSEQEQDEESSSPFLLTVTTPPDDQVVQQTMEASDIAAQQDMTYYFPATSMARTLDALGWTKVFCDVRDKLVSVPIPFNRKGKDGTDDCSSEFDTHSTKQWTSHQLKNKLANRIDYDQKWPIPIGHTMLIANSKSKLYAKLNRGGLEFVQHMAHDFLKDLLIVPTCMNMTTGKDEPSS
ncbi:Putative serine esterase (DUF676) [Seminavis robusta]|uniref:Serine esterase (DUF676) n=1 Tax=Seminavis robusta TaxID=568900 RepID=A0A9N8E4X7_9STRA|nr:Putative serine esterase (DUF676) [Seminavis robusta]|eukprot:Sro523_g159810.1 Putative serine esterase (DUF676) (514) ;mRNA; f:44893-46434